MAAAPERRAEVSLDRGSHAARRMAVLIGQTRHVSAPGKEGPVWERMSEGEVVTWKKTREEILRTG